VGILGFCRVGGPGTAYLWKKTILNFLINFNIIPILFSLAILAREVN